METIFKEARINKENGKGYKAYRHFILWENSNTSWNHISFRYGIRWSDKWQLFPIWNMSDNNNRSLLFGLWKVYCEFSYHRKGTFNQNINFPFKYKLSRFYRLMF
jgi:hypothetical protein